ncbi:MAG TPA: hypothetical protein EYQ24_07815 [Bacteroidetes bacterium]|nr:hypothetical protein [Bacteroidota bacterium]
MRLLLALFLLAAVGFAQATPLADSPTADAHLALSRAQSDVNTFAVLVAPRDTPAYAFAQSNANDASVFAERKLWRGLNKAAELLNEGGNRTVMVLIAEGTYDGQFGTGVWKVPPVDNASGTLQIMGGYNEQFNGRQPFGLPVRLQTIYGRDGAILQFEQGTQLRELIVSGLLLDAAPSNAYDAQTNSIKKGESRHMTIVSMGRMVSERVTFADNIFLNGDRRAIDLTWSPASPDAEVHLVNNFFLNNLICLETKIYGRTISDRGGRLVVRHNSFILNWPYNPDNTSSNVGTVELYHRDSFRELVFERNLFAYNSGGVFQHDWPLNRMPDDIAIRENLFFGNGALWGDGEPGAAVMVGKFGTSPTYRVLSLEDVEDDYDADLAGNVAFNPEIPVVLLPLQGVNSGDVQAEVSVLNDVRRMFGMNTDGGTVAIQNFAPALSYDTRLLPLPQNDDAKAYGVQPTALYGMTTASDS